MEKKHKKLSPLPWEAVEAQHNWLMEQFEQGLNYARQCSRFYEDQLTLSTELPVYQRQSTFNQRNFRFVLGGTSLANYVQDLREGNILPSETLDIVDVKMSYMHTLHLLRFEVRRKGRVYHTHLHDEQAARMSDTEIREFAIKELTYMIKGIENDEVERQRL